MIREKLRVGGIEILHRRSEPKRGLALVLVHGGGSNSGLLSWSTVLPALARRHRLFVPDLPGFGQSSELLEDYRSEDLVNFLASYLRELQLDRYVLVGLSLGGMISLGTALQNPPATTGLVLVDTIGLGSPVPVFAVAALAARFPSLHRVIISCAGRSDRFLRIGLRYNLHNTSLIDAVLIGQVRRCLDGPGSSEAWVRFLSREVTGRRFVTDFTDRVSSFEKPVLLLHGENDRLVPVASIRAAAPLFHRARLEVFQQCGHWLPREYPEKFAAVVAAFLSELDRNGI